MHLTSYVRTILYRGTFRVTQKNIMTTPVNLQEVLDGIKNNPYYNKYAPKITHLQKEDPVQFNSRVKELGKEKIKEKSSHEERQYSQLLNPKEKVTKKEQISYKPLQEIMKIDLVKDKEANEIKSIWEEYHSHRDCCIAATIPVADFEKLKNCSEKFPTFLFALPRSQGYEFIMSQFSYNCVYFTPLLYYQVHKENAPECLRLIHYDELKNSKGIVLMRGEYDKNVLDAKEAQCLANQLQMYYVQQDPEKMKLLEIFTYKPDEFKHIDLINQIETLSLV